MDTSNQKKYDSKNPIKKTLIQNFNRVVIDLIKSKKPKSILDAGCGEGYLLKEIVDNFYCRVVGCDINAGAVNKCNNLVGNQIEVKLCSLYKLPFKNNEFDMVLCTEVFEHLINPGDALLELKRVCQKYLIITVPFEPLFRIGNLIFFNHIKTLGNAPGHINHWNKKTLSSFLNMYFNSIELHIALPWMIAIACLNNNKNISARNPCKK